MPLRTPTPTEMPAQHNAHRLGGWCVIRLLALLSPQEEECSTAPSSPTSEAQGCAVFCAVQWCHALPCAEFAPKE